MLFRSKGVTEGNLTGDCFSRILKINLKTGEKIKKEKETPKNESDFPAIYVDLECECGSQTRKIFNIFNDNILLALKAQRCAACKKFGIQTASGVFNNKPFKKKVMKDKKYNVMMEQFVK